MMLRGSSRPGWWAVALVVIAPALTGCDAEADEQDHLPDLATLPEFHLAPTPTAVIGDSDQPGHQLADVVGAHRTSDGRVIVADAGRTELLEYDGSGVFLGMIARGGEGPGELARPRATAMAAGDTLVVWDGRRVTRFSGEGAYLSAVPRGDLPPAEVRGAGMPGSWARIVPLTDGSLVAVDPAFPSFIASRGPDGVRRDTLSLPILGPDGSLAGAIEDLPGPETLVTAGVSLSPFPMGRRLLVAPGPGKVYVGTGVDPEILVFSNRGEPLGRIELPFRARPVPDEVWDDVESRLASMRLEGLERPGSLPPFVDLVVDRLGRIWLAEYRAEPSEPRRWIVLGPEGEPRARVVAEGEGGRLLEAGADYVILLERDDLDVPRVVVVEARAEARATDPPPTDLEDGNARGRRAAPLHLSLATEMSAFVQVR